MHGVRAQGSGIQPFSFDMVVTVNTKPPNIGVCDNLGSASSNADDKVGMQLHVQYATVQTKH
jgi:hypothetical protein